MYKSKCALCWIIIFLSTFLIAQKNTWYLHGKNFEIRKVEKNSEEKNTSYIQYSNFTVDYENTLIALRKEKTLYSECTDNARTISTQFSELYLQTNIRKNGYLLLVTLPKITEITINKNLPEIEVEFDSFLALTENGKTTLQWEGYIPEKVYQKLLKQSSDSNWQEAIDNLYYKNQQDHKKITIGWAKSENIIDGSRYVQKHLENTVYFLAPDYSPLEVDRVGLEKSNKKKITKTDSTGIISVKFPKDLQNRVAYDEEQRLVLHGEMDRELYQRLCKLPNPHPKLYNRQMWKSFWLNPVNELYIKARIGNTISGKAVLRNHIEQAKNIVVKFYPSPTKEQKPIDSLRVLRPFYIYTKQVVDDKEWFLLGNQDSIDITDIQNSLVGWVALDNLIIWSTAQSLEFNSSNRKQRVVKKDLNLGEIYPNLSNSQKAIDGETYKVIAKETMLDDNKNRYLPRMKVLDKKTLVAGSGKKINAYKVAYIAHNMKLKLITEQRKALLDSLKQKDQLAITEIVFVLDGTADTEPYAAKIYDVIEQIFLQMEQRVKKLEEFVNNADESKEISDPFARFLKKYRLKPKLRVALIVYRDTDDVIKEDGKIYSAECNFYDFTHFNKFRKNFKKIEFGGGGGDQSSQRNALWSLFNQKFTFTHPEVHYKTKPTPLSWTPGSNRFVFLLGDVGQKHNISNSWNAQKFIKTWKKTGKRFNLFSIQHGQPESTVGHRRFKAFANEVATGMNIGKIKYGYYTILNQNSLQQMVKKVWSRIEEDAEKLQEKIYDIVQSAGKEKAKEEYGSVFQEVDKMRLLERIATSVEYHAHLPSNLPDKLAQLFYYNPQLKKIFLYKRLNQKNYQSLRNLSFNKEWIDAIDTLYKESKKQIDLTEGVGLYDEGWILEKDLYSVLGFRDQSSSQIEFSIFINKIEFMESITILAKFAQAIQQGSPDTAEIVWKEHIKKILKALFGIKDESDLPFRRKNIIIAGGLWDLSLQEIIDLPREVLIKLASDISNRKLGTMGSYNDNSDNWGSLDLEESKSASKNVYSYVPAKMFKINISDYTRK